MAESGATTSLLAGLKNNSPSAVDASMKPPSGSVNTDAVRTSVAKGPPTLGPRTA